MALLGPGFAPGGAHAQSAPSCAPSTLNVSQALASGAVTVSPAPDSMDASYLTQISFLGVPAGELEDVSVSGSRSGPHNGQLEAYSQGDGASFLPSKPFSQGETVTVRAILHQGSGTTPVSWHFTTAEVDTTSRSLETPPPAPPPPKASELEHYSSRPDLRPPNVSVTTDGAGQAPGDIFLAPYAGPGQYGPMILNGSGQLVWFKPIPHGERAADLRVQQYDDQPVLTWWQDPLIADGQRNAGVVIADDSYHDIQIMRAGNGYQPDLHAFEITPKGTALFTVYAAILCNLSAYGGPADGAVADTLFQEIDLKTGLVRYEWHALDHVRLSNSYMPIGGGGTPHSPWDWFHINAVSEHPGTLLVDSRNTWAAYEVSAASGEVLWRLGGKQSSFHMGPGASPAWQHDVREEPDGTISFFDNGATPKVHPQSRVIELQLNKQAMTATLMLSFEHPTPLSVASQGDFQPLADGNWFTGWGQEPFFTEYSAEGKVLLDAHLPAAYQSYTVLKFPWTGRPRTAPALRLLASAHGLSAYVSWNGASTVASYRALEGASPSALKPGRQVGRQGFESTIPIGRSARYVEVQALDGAGNVLASSAAQRVPSAP